MTEKWKKDRETFEKELPSRLLSFVSLLIAFIHFAESGWKADWILFAFIVLCFAPWLGYAFESVGGDKWGIKYPKAEQGQASVPPPPRADLAEKPAAPELSATVVKPAPPEPAAIRQVPEPSSTAGEFTYQELKILATLWKYQKTQAPNSRWTFMVLQGSPDYPAFLRSLLLLARKELAGIAPNIPQVMLTDKGVAYCQAHDRELSEWRDTYDKFAN